MAILSVWYLCTQTVVLYRWYAWPAPTSIYPFVSVGIITTQLAVLLFGSFGEGCGTLEYGEVGLSCGRDLPVFQQPHL